MHFQSSVVLRGRECNEEGEVICVMVIPDLERVWSHPYAS